MTQEDRQELCNQLRAIGLFGNTQAIAAANELERQAKRIQVLENELNLCQETNRAWLQKSGLSRQDLTQS